MTLVSRGADLCLKLVISLFVVGFISASSFASTKIAITVDDLPVHGNLLDSESRMEITNQFIEIFKKHKIKEAYGFVNAKKVAETPESKSSLVAWIEAGYPLANHSYSHMNLNKNSADDFIKDIQMGEPILNELVKDESYKWFRYPFLHEGDTSEKRNAVRDALTKMNYQIAQVTIDFEDWAWNNPYVRCVKAGNQKAIKWLEKSYIEHAIRRLNFSISQAKVIFGRDMNHILLLHIGTFDAKMLDRLLTAFEKRGTEFISLAEAESDRAYMLDPGGTHAQGNELLTQLIDSKKLPSPKVTPLPLERLAALCSR
jgi:peptidoglycan-N-acetylglucosamine deacetylase